MESPMMLKGTNVVERVRIVSVGDVGVGKSCLIKKYCEPDKFVKTHLPTIGVDYGSKKSASVARNDGKIVDIDFFDLSGNTCVPICIPILLLRCVDTITFVQFPIQLFFCRRS